MSKFLNNFEYIGMEDLSNEFFIENSSINIEILNNITRKITAGAYPICITEIE